MARIGPGGLEIGYWVHRAWTRRGLATAATAALVDQAFRLPGVDRVEIIHDELNVASGKIPRKLGFTEIERRPLDPPALGGTGYRRGLAPAQNRYNERGSVTAMAYGQRSRR